MGKPLQPKVSLVLFLAAFASSIGAAPAGAQSDDYASCTALVRTDPKAAADRASQWETQGGGQPARHCAAVALFAMGEFGEAAVRLEALAQDMAEAPPTVRAEVFAQAGQAWLAAGDYARAETIFSTAHELYPASVEILVDRGQARILLARYWDAVDDLNAALEREPDHTDALIFRATAYRLLEVPELALDDVEQALDKEPQNVYALVERGLIRKMQGDPDGARDDWMSVLRTAPEGDAADGARRYLEELDVRTN